MCMSHTGMYVCVCPTKVSIHTCGIYSYLRYLFIPLSESMSHKGVYVCVCPTKSPELPPKRLGHVHIHASVCVCGCVCVFVCVRVCVCVYAYVKEPRVAAKKAWPW